MEVEAGVATSTSFGLCGDVSTLSRSLVGGMVSYTSSSTFGLSGFTSSVSTWSCSADFVSCAAATAFDALEVFFFEGSAELSLSFFFEAFCFLSCSTWR